MTWSHTNAIRTEIRYGDLRRGLSLDRFPRRMGSRLHPSSRLCLTPGLRLQLVLCLLCDTSLAVDQRRPMDIRRKFTGCLWRTSPERTSGRQTIRTVILDHRLRRSQSVLRPPGVLARNAARSPHNSRLPSPKMNLSADYLDTDLRTCSILLNLVALEA
jgi:hypothetical protein